MKIGCIESLLVELLTWVPFYLVSYDDIIYAFASKTREGVVFIEYIVAKGA